MYITERKNTDVKGRCYDVQPLNTDRLQQLLQYGQIDSCQETLKLFLNEIEFGWFESQMLRLYVVMDIYILARTFTKKLGIPGELFMERFGSLDDIEQSLTTPTSAVTYLNEMLIQCIRWRIALLREDGNESIRKARRYMEANYMLDTISLKSVASVINLSPTYFSALFKKSMGTNFSDYLTRIRIDKAKELLCCTTKLVSEIAYETGFSDYRYFSHIFKKYTGQTPREFQCIRNRES